MFKVKTNTGWKNGFTDEYCLFCFSQRTALGMWVFRSKSSPVSSGDSPRGACKGYIFALEVAEELEQWPEQDTHGRQWVSC